MRYFKNNELIERFRVSDKAIRNWIEKAQLGKNDLDLIQHRGRIYIADSLHNGLLLESLAQNGKKYRNKRTLRALTPSAMFYEIYSNEQVLDIINNIDKYREAPLQYCYIRESAKYWDAYLRKLHSVSNSYVTSTIELLSLERDYLNSLIKNYDYVNVIDVGVGNGLAVKDLLGQLLSTGKLMRYTGVDISPDLLDIATRNIQKWFNNSIPVEKYIKDITHQRFEKALASSTYGKDAASTLNLVLFLGGTVTNFRRPEQALKILRDSIGKDDILMTTVKLDSEKSRRFFDYNIKDDKDILTVQDRWLLDLLSIDKSLYEVEQFFDEKQMARLVQVRLKVDISISFQLGNYSKMVEIHKGEAILLVRMLHFTDKEITKLYEENCFSHVKTAKTHNKEYMLLISQVEEDSHQPSPVTASP